MSKKSKDLEGCNFDKVDDRIFYYMRIPNSETSFSGTQEGYVKYLCDNNLVGDQKVGVLIRADKVESLENCNHEGMEVLSKINEIWAARINFDCLVSLLKNPSILSISL